MKKISFALIVVAMALLASCSTEPQQTADQTNQIEQKSDSLAQKPSAESANLQLAIRIAKYGYEYESAEALVEAADIMITTQISRLDATPELQDENGNALEAAEPAKPLDPATLLADAKSFAGNDETILNMIEREQQKLAASLSDAATRGGSSSHGFITESVGAHQSEIYHIEFYKNKAARVELVGDGNSILNLYIYDKDGNLIVSDMGEGDVRACEWTPTETSNHIIKIINRGNNPDDYSLTIER